MPKIQKIKRSKLANIFKTKNDKQDIAKKIGMSYGVVCNYISGTRNPTWHTIEKFMLATNGIIKPSDFEIDNTPQEDL